MPQGDWFQKMCIVKLHCMRKNQQKSTKKPSYLKFCGTNSKLHTWELKAAYLEALLYFLKNYINQL